VPTPVPVARDEVVVDRKATDEPMTAEQAEAAHNAEPQTVVVGPHDAE
jgi:stress response protein YsnF